MQCSATIFTVMKQPDFWGSNDSVPYISFNLNHSVLHEALNLCKFCVNCSVLKFSHEDDKKLIKEESLIYVHSATVKGLTGSLPLRIVIIGTIRATPSSLLQVTVICLFMIGVLTRNTYVN